MINIKELEKTPDIAKDKSHHYCDYIELLALCSGEDGVSTSDVYNRFLNDDRITGAGSDAGAEENDEWMSTISSWFSEISSRDAAYGECYPFKLDDFRLKLKSDISDRNRIYLGLLLCSSLRNIENSSLLSSSFEYISQNAMKHYLPPTAEVHIFGVSSRTRGRYQGSLEDKVKQLAKDTQYPLNPKPGLFRQRDNGDGGVDIVAWIPFQFDTSLDRKLFFVGQSAATFNWSTKQHSVERLSNYLVIDNTPIKTIYVPFDMRDSDRRIVEWRDITTDVVFDRHRICKLICPTDVFNSDIGNDFYQAIQTAILYEEDIV